MKLTCPSCGCFGSPDVFIGEAETLDALRLSLSAPESLAGALHGYLRLFAPPKRSLTSRRVKGLLDELLPMIKAGKIERKGRTWPAPAAYWQAAMEEMVTRREALRLPLSGHGYLLEIVAGQAARAEGAAEARREAERAYPYSQVRTPSAAPLPLSAIAAPAAKPEKTPPPPEVAASIAKFTRKKPS